jgi:hypothetical protein
MRNSFRRGLTLAALAGAGVLAVAPAALAQPSTSPEAFGLGASGFLVSVPNTPDQTTIGTSTAVSVGVDDVLTANALSATVTNVNNTSASVTSLTSPALPLLGLISAGAITTSCVANANGSFTGTTSIVNLSILGATYNGTTTTQTPLTITVPGGIASASVIVDQQIANAGPNPPAGSETVNGVAIQFTVAGATETVDIASATCGPYTSGVPVASFKGMGIGLGALSLFGAGVGTVYVRRRNAAGQAI